MDTFEYHKKTTVTKTVGERSFKRVGGCCEPIAILSI